MSEEVSGSAQTTSSAPEELSLETAAQREGSKTGRVCKVIARCWITGKVSSPFKISFGDINTLVGEVLSDLKY